MNELEESLKEYEVLCKKHKMRFFVECGGCDLQVKDLLTAREYYQVIDKNGKTEWDKACKN